MKKNVASQVVGAQMVSAADGSAFTGAVTVSVTGDAGTQATGSVGAGACTHEGNGFHTYAPAQAETNYDHVAFTFTGTGAIPATIQIYASFPQTGDNFARLGAPAGASISADIAAIESQTDDIGAAGAGLTAADDAILTAIAALNNLSAAQVNAEVVDALNVDTYAESAVPAATASLAAKIRWLATLARNKITQTATTQTVRNDADSGNLATSAVSDDGTTFTRGEFS